MQQLTVRGFEPELADRIRRLAQQERISLNQAVLRLLRRGAGLDTDQSGDDTVGASLDHFIGSWTGRQADEMDRALADFDHIDESTELISSDGHFKDVDGLAWVHVPVE